MTSDFAPFTVRAPASTANFGSAFDAVGMALDLWLEARVEPADANRFEIRGEGEDEILGPANSNLIFRAAYIGAAGLGIALPPPANSCIKYDPVGAWAGKQRSRVRSRPAHCKYGCRT